MARYPGLTLRILAEDTAAIGPGKAQLIALIDSTGSISAAARAMGMSYSRAWQLVDELNASFKEPIVVTAIGGKRGGGTGVTDYGRQVHALYAQMEDKASAAIRAGLKQFAGRLKKPPIKR